MTWIQTYTGRAFDLVDPQPDMVEILDIAHALAHQCRFMGHTASFYSVAEHSLLVSDRVPRGDAFEGLMHDAAEAYCVDLAAPIKRLPGLAGYCEYEKQVRAVIAARFGLKPALPSSVVEADLRMLMTEAKLMHRPPPKDWGVPHEPYSDVSVFYFPPLEATAAFLERFRDFWVVEEDTGAA